MRRVGEAPDAIYAKSRQLYNVFQSYLQFPILEHGRCRTGEIHWHMKFGSRMAGPLI